MGKIYCKYCLYKIRQDELSGIDYCKKTPTYDYSYDEAIIDYVEECQDINEDNDCGLFKLNKRGRLLRWFRCKKEEIPPAPPKKKKVRPTKPVDNRFEIMDI